MHHGREVVQTVGQSQGLRIGHALPHLLDTTVDIAEVRIDALHGLAVDQSLEAEHTVGRRVVRTDVHHIVVIAEATLLVGYQVSVLAQGIFHSEVILRLVGARELVGLGAHVEVLAQGVALEVGAEEETAHVRVTQELDADEIEYLALQQVCSLPEIDDCRNHVRTVHLLGDGLHGATLVVLSVLQDVDTSKTFLTEVLTDDGNKVVEMLLVLQLRHLSGKVVKTQFNVIQFHVLIPYYINQLDLSGDRSPQVLQLR